MASREEMQKKIVDIFNWKGYSSLQKLFVVSFVTIILSWLGSLWTLIIILAACVVAGVKLSDKVLHHDKASLIAEQLFFNLESAYINVKSHFQQIQEALLKDKDADDESNLPANIIDDLSAFYDNQADKSNEDGRTNESCRISTAIRLEINSIQLLIIRDFVRSWYARFSYDPQFLKESKQLLEQAFNNLATHLAQQDSKVLITKIIQQYHIHLIMFQRAKNSYESHKIHPKTKVVTDAKFKRHSSVDEAFEQLSSFHPALLSKESELGYLQGVVSVIILSVCSGGIFEGECARTLLIQILSSNVMLPLMQMMSNPDWLMEVIILLTSEDDESSHSESTLSGGENNNQNREEQKGAKAETVSKPVEHSYQSQDKTDTGEGNSLHEVHECVDLDKTILSYEHEGDERAANKSIEEKLQPNSTSNSVNQVGSNVHFPLHSVSEEPVKSGEVSSQEIVSTHDITSTKCPFFEKHETENFAPVPEEREDTLIDGGVDAEEFWENPAYFEEDPQRILSYGKRHSVTSLDSDISHITGSSVDGNTYASADSDSNVDASSSSFPKLSSIKNFFGVKKPKTLALVSEKISSNLKPFTSKTSTKQSDEASSALSPLPPQLQVEGVPVDNHESKSHSPPSSTSASAKAIHPTTSYSDSELTPSPGFFSHISFFSSSSSHNDLNSHTVPEAVEESPLPTPSPTNQPEFNISMVAVIKDATDDPNVISTSFVPDDGRIFQDVSIPQTMINNEFRSSTQYSLYVIEYEALYFTEEGKSILRSGVVKRRYREFTSLQSRLEGHRTYKKYLKKIRGPKRWPSLPFKSIDKEQVEERRVFLEKYLKDLIEIEAICNGPDLREFLAYEGDTHIAFVKKAPDITVPRFDKMFMRGVSEVVDRIKALPNIPQEMISGLRSRETLEEKLTRVRSQMDADMIDIDMGFYDEGIWETDNILQAICTQVITDIHMDEEKELFNVSTVMEDEKNVEQAKEEYKQEMDKVLASLPRILGDGSETPDEEDLKEANKPDLGFAVLDLLVQGLQGHDHWLCRERVVRCMQSVLGKALNRYLENSISHLTSEAHLTHYLRLLRETIWPQGQFMSESTLPKTDEERAATRERAKQCLVNFFPESVKMVIGRSDFTEMIELFLTSLESQQLNRHLLYQILDLLMEQLFPEVSGHDLLHDLLFSKSAKKLSITP